MDDKNKKAIKAGLIGAVLIVIVRVITNLIFYWSMSHPGVQNFINQSANSTSPVPTNFSNAPSEAFISGFAVISESLSIYVIYLLAGAIAAYYIAPSLRFTNRGNVVIQSVICGAIAGATAQAVSAPLILPFLFVLYPPTTNINILHWHWLSWLTTQYVDMMATAIILGAISALIFGVIANACCRGQTTD